MKRILGKISKSALLLALLFVLPTSLFAAGEAEGGASGSDQVIGKAKYVFLFVGDGMGMPQINAAEAYLSSIRGKEAASDKLSFSEFPATGLTTTYAEDRFITGSAASATAMSCGEKTTINTIAMNGARTKDLKTIAEMARDTGMKVGIISSVNIDHATPAAFYAHSPHRSEYYKIGLQMPESGFDYFGGGMARIDKTPDGQMSVHDAFTRSAYAVVDSKRAFNSLSQNDLPVYAYTKGFAGNALDYEMDRKSSDISLAEFTAKGIELLDNPDGFFMMVEGGKIDWACHANDATAAIHDTFAFDEAVKEAIDFYNDHPHETLIVVTGDHECGGLTLGFAGTKYETAFTKLAEQRISFEKFNADVFEPYKASRNAATANIYDLMGDIEDYFGLDVSELSDAEKEMLSRAFLRSMEGKVERAVQEDTFVLYGGYEPLTVTITHILNQKAGLSWTSYSHTGVPVPTFAMGVGENQFNGYYDNTDIFHKMVKSMKLSSAVAAK